MVASQAGGRAELEIGTLMVKRLRVHGTVLRGARHRREDARPPTHSRATSCRCSKTVGLRPVIARTFPLDDAPEAYDLLAADAVFGKIVLDLTQLCRALHRCRR